MKEHKQANSWNAPARLVGMATSMPSSPIEKNSYQQESSRTDQLTMESRNRRPVRQQSTRTGVRAVAAPAIEPAVGQQVNSEQENQMTQSIKVRAHSR